jgi:hypothetical protein
MRATGRPAPSRVGRGPSALADNGNGCEHNATLSTIKMARRATSFTQVILGAMLVTVAFTGLFGSIDKIHFRVDIRGVDRTRTTAVPRTIQTQGNENASGKAPLSCLYCLNWLIRYLFRSWIFSLILVARDLAAEDFYQDPLPSSSRLTNRLRFVRI